MTSRRGSAGERNAAEGRGRLLADSRVGIARRGDERGYNPPQWRQTGAAGIATPGADRVDRARAHGPEAVVASWRGSARSGHLVGGPMSEHVHGFDSSEHIVVVDELVQHHCRGAGEVGDVENPVSLVPPDRARWCLEVGACFTGAVPHGNDEADVAAVGSRFYIDIRVEVSGEAVARLNFPGADDETPGSAIVPRRDLEDRKSGPVHPLIEEGLVVAAGGLLERLAQVVGDDVAVRVRR